MSATDPLATVHEALDRAGCQPRGPAHKLTARCPAHDDRSPSLSVGVGGDGSALVCCHAGCNVEQVITALGLTWADLFPPNHRRARRRNLPNAQRTDFHGSAREFVNVIMAAELLGMEWYGEIRMDCVSCGSPAALL
jgi:hypothetical protein